MTQNDAELMRKMMQVINPSSQPEQPVEEAFPILKQQLKSKLTGLASKFSSRMAGKNLVQKALVPYLQLFAMVMGRKNQNWDTVTWKTLADFVTSSASLRLPMGEFEPQRLTVQEFDDLIADPEARARIKKYVTGATVNFNALLPPGGVSGILNRAVSTPVADDKAGVTQKFVTGLLVAVIQALFDKAEGSGEYSAGQTTTSAQQQQPQAQAPAQQAQTASQPQAQQPPTQPSAAQPAQQPATQPSAAQPAQPASAAPTAYQISLLKQILGIP